MSRWRIEADDAKQDNILDRMAPSDLRLLIGERDRAEAEAQALRGEVEAANDRADTLEHRMMGMMTRHFAESWRNRDTQKALDGYLSAGIAELERERDAALAEVAALRARVAVPDGYVLVPVVATDDMVEHVMATGLYHDKNAFAVLRDEYRHMVEAAPRINGKVVSEGLLRSIVSIYFRSVIDEAHWTDMHGEIEELRALLGEGE